MFALIRLARTPPRILSPATQSPSDPEEFERFRREQVVIMRSERLIQEALKQKELADLQFLRQQTNPVDWLRNHLRIDFPEDATIMRIGIDGEDATALTVVIDALVRSYLDNIVYVERLEHNQEVTALERAYGHITEQLNAKKAGLRKALENVGSGLELRVEEQLGIQQVAELRLQLQRLRSKRLMAEAVGTAKEEIAKLEVQEHLLSGELSIATKSLVSLQSLAEIEDMKNEIASDTEFANKLRQQLNAQRLELQAPARQTLYQAARQ